MHLLLVFQRKVSIKLSLRVIVKQFNILLKLYFPSDLDLSISCLSTSSLACNSFDTNFNKSRSYILYISEFHLHTLMI